MIDKSKEAVMLAKLIVGLAMFTSIVIYPPVLLAGIVGWAGWTLWRNYTV